MDKNKNCTACNVKLDEDIFKNDRTIRKNCYNNRKRRKSNKILVQNIITASHQEPKIENVSNTNNNRTLINRFSN